MKPETKGLVLAGIISTIIGIAGYYAVNGMVERMLGSCKDQEHSYCQTLYNQSHLIDNLLVIAVPILFLVGVIYKDVTRQKDNS